MYQQNNSTHIEDEDQCMTCAHQNKGLACPLLQALGMNIVCIVDAGGITVTNCGFYEEFKRTLKVVKEK